MLNLYFDVQNAYKANNPVEPLYTNLDTQGRPMTDPSNPNRYVLRQIPGIGGTLLPTVGMMIKF